jgi:hypothetical protein
MNWTEALGAMQCGRAVRRVSEAVRSTETFMGTTVVVDGAEPINLVVACTADMHPVHVFAGTWSRVLCRPSEEDMKADDWIAVPR